MCSYPRQLRRLNRSVHAISPGLQSLGWSVCQGLAGQRSLCRCCPQCPAPQWCPWTVRPAASSGELCENSLPSVNSSATFTASHHGTLHQLIHLPLLLPHTMAPSISQYVCHVYCLTWHRPSVHMSTTFTASHHGTIHQSSSTFAASHHGTIHQSIHLPLSLPHIMAVFCIKKKKSMHFFKECLWLLQIVQYQYSTKWWV